MIFNGFILGAVGAGLLQVAYFAVREAWPLAYAALVETYAITLPQRLWRVLIFRFAPALIASSALVITSWRVGAVDWIAVSFAIGLHLVLTNVRAIAVTLLRADPTERVNYISYHLVAIALVVPAAVLGALLAPHVGEFVPNPAELVQNLWFAGFVAIVGAALLKASSRRVPGQMPYSAEYFVWRANRDVGIKTLDAVFGAAQRHRVDPVLLKALMVSEVLQRPKWMRVLENFKGRIFPSGSYGVMQVASAQPISDLESIERVAAALSGTWAFSVKPPPVPTIPQRLEIDDAVLWTAAGSHNGEKPFIESVTDIYRHLFYVEYYEWNSWAGTSAKVIEFRRYADRIAVRVVTNALDFSIVPSPSLVAIPSVSAVSEWRVVQIDLPPDSISFVAHVDGFVFEQVDVNSVALAR